MSFLLLAACSHEAPTGTAPAPSVAISSGAVDEPPGIKACTLLADAIARSTLMNAEVIDGIVAASTTANASVAGAARRLGEAYGKAIDAKGTEEEPDRIAGVSAAAADMSTICADSGLRSVG